MRRFLSIEPTPRGFGYAVMEIDKGQEFLVDWGLAYLRDKGVNGYRKRLKAMLRRYRPDFLVLPNVSVSRRGRRVKRVVEAMAEVAERAGVAVKFVSSDEVKRRWGVRTKRELAVAVVGRFPELRAFLPTGQSECLASV